MQKDTPLTSGLIQSSLDEISSKSTNSIDIPATINPAIQFYVQIGVLILAFLLCVIGIIVQPTGPNVQWFQSIATFCLGLVLPNPKHV